MDSLFTHGALAGKQLSELESWQLNHLLGGIEVEGVKWGELTKEQIALVEAEVFAREVAAATAIAASPAPAPIAPEPTPEPAPQPTSAPTADLTPTPEPTP